MPPNRSSLWAGCNPDGRRLAVNHEAQNQILVFDPDRLSNRVVLRNCRSVGWDPRQVVVARDRFVVDNKREKQAAIEGNNQMHAHTPPGSRAPDRAGGSHILAYAHTAQQQHESPLIGIPDEILAKLETLRAAGVAYVMLNPAGLTANLRCFAREVMSHVAAHGCL